MRRAGPQPPTRQNLPRPRSARLRSFAPFADARARILILGTMPGPVALRKQEYYGFPGNHFWPILSSLFAGGRPLTYPEKLRLLRRNRIALWDVLASCEREGASDGAIRNARPNEIPELLARFPGIATIALNGTAAARLYQLHFREIALPVIRLPSTSPAHARMTLAEKRARWSVIVGAVAAPRTGSQGRTPRAPR